jgi:hypothetical protein
MNCLIDKDEISIRDPVTVSMYRQDLAMKECNNCGTYVTPDFARVFGNGEDEVFGCPRCSSFSDLMSGRGAKPGT